MYFIVNLKEKYHIRRNINSKKKEMFMREVSIIILIYPKLRSVGPVQQKIEFPLPYHYSELLPQ